MEETLDVTVDENLSDSVLRSSLERLTEEISENADGIAVELTENELREFRGILAARLPTVEQQREGGITAEERINGLRTEETHWREEAERRSDPKKKLLCDSIADVAALKADKLRLRANVRPEGELARSIVEEEAENNDLTRFERFKRWAKRNLGGISIVAISVASIITTIVMGARNAAKGLERHEQTRKDPRKDSRKGRTRTWRAPKPSRRGPEVGSDGHRIPIQKPLASGRHDRVRVV